ncbi:MAG: FAD-dependent oxidoreductase [Arenicella sp.]|nr:FAD-dependent oxidoreductase [Arenicella sp.]
MQNELDTELWRPVQQLRLIKNKGQHEYYKTRLHQAEYAGILNDQMRTNHPFCDTPYGVVDIALTAVVNVAGLLQKMRLWLADRDSIMDAVVDYQKIQSADGNFLIQDVKAAKIIFCEGHQATDNPWLSKLPFKLSKGEVLTVDPGASVSQMYNWGNWLVPTSQGIKLGSTFEWSNLTMSPDPERGEDLLTSLRKFTNLSATTIRHSVGIRPTTLRRTPFVGPITALKGSYCFNGFGSKGCLLIPYYAQLLCRNVLFQEALPGELTQCL